MKQSPSRRSTTDIEPSGIFRWPSLSYGVLPLTIMILVAIACLIGYSLANASLEDSRARTIDRRLSENELQLTSVFNSYAHLQWGSVGHVQSSASDNKSWQEFIDVFNLRKNFAGMEAVGLSVGDSPANNTITYVSPKTELTEARIGYNMGVSAPLAEAMTRAARSGETTLTGTVQNVFSTKDDISTKRPGFLMYTPIYDPAKPQTTADERTQALIGFTVSMFRGDVFFPPIFSQDDLKHNRIQIYLDDVKQENLLYEGGKTTDADIRTAKQEITLYGRTFTIIYTLDTNHILIWFTTYFPEFLLFGGLFFGLLFAGVSGYLLRNRYHHLVYEKERDVEFAKDELLSLASHQLRTPATGVKQYLGMVLQGFAGDVTSKQREYLERAYASNNRQLGVINDILHLAKLETGRIVLAESKFDLAKMVRDVLDEQREQAERSGIALHVEAPSQGMTLGDSHMLRMVVENLVSNAIKYTPQGGEVHVRMSRRANRWVIMVKDTGVGIAKSDFPKLFKQFSRINNPRSEVVTGTGVGLYLAYHLMVLHGGTISVSSRKGKGSTFTMRLPRRI